MHNHQLNIIERAYQLARESDSIEGIKKQLGNEGYTQVEAHLQGPKIRSDLKKVMADGERQRPTQPSGAILA